MIIPDKKKMASAIVAKFGKEPESSKPEESSDHSQEGLKSAAEDILQAIKDNDASALVEALCSFKEIHSNESSEESKSDEESDEEP